METKALLRMRKFSWNKTHSVRIAADRRSSTPDPPVALKRSGSMNNIILGLRSEAIGNHHSHNGNRKRRTQTFRLKKKSSKAGLDNNGTSNKKADESTTTASSQHHLDLLSLHNQDFDNVTPLARLSIFAPLVGIPTTDVSFCNVTFRKMSLWHDYRNASNKRPGAY